MWLMIQVSVTVTYDTLTGAFCRGNISVTNYTIISMYQMLQFRVPYAVLCGIVWVSESCIICTWLLIACSLRVQMIQTFVTWIKNPYMFFETFIMFCVSFVTPIKWASYGCISCNESYTLLDNENLVLSSVFERILCDIGNITK